MPDFLLEIGCEEIPARMIAAASAELRERVAALLTRERLSGGEVTRELHTKLRTSIRRDGWRCWQLALLLRRPTWSSKSPGLRFTLPIRMATPRLRPMHSPRRLASTWSIWKKSRPPRVNTWLRRSREKAAAQRRFSPRACPRNSPPFTGPRICTGEAERALCAARALAGRDARRRDDSAGIRWHSSR